MEKETFFRKQGLKQILLKFSNLFKISNFFKTIVLLTGSKNKFTSGTMNLNFHDFLFCSIGIVFLNQKQYA